MQCGIGGEVICGEELRLMGFAGVFGVSDFSLLDLFESRLEFGLWSFRSFRRFTGFLILVAVSAFAQCVGAEFGIAGIIVLRYLPQLGEAIDDFLRDGAAADFL